MNITRGGREGEGVVGIEIWPDKEFILTAINIMLCFCVFRTTSPGPNLLQEQ